MAGKRKDESTNSQQEIMAPVENPIVVREHPMTALWFGQRLFLARLVTIDGADFVQGCEINWPGVQQALAASAIDMLPMPTFAPASGPDAAAEHRLASLPVRLSPGEVRLKLDPATEASPVRMALWVAWGAVLMAALAVGLVLRSTVSLSERRADFVSAVTHELRTPLTTLRMYTELLSTGRVKDDTSRGEYLDTMHAEAVRLSHLVENVLSYARAWNAAGHVTAPNKSACSHFWTVSAVRCWNAQGRRAWNWPSPSRPMPPAVLCAWTRLP